MRFAIFGIHKTSELDVFEHGCTGPLTCAFIDLTFYDKTLVGLVSQIENMTGAKFAPEQIDGEQNRLDFQSLEGGEAFPVSPRELSLWKKGQFDAYVCTYTVYVKVVDDADCSELFA